MAKLKLLLVCLFLPFQLFSQKIDGIQVINNDGEPIEGVMVTVNRKLAGTTDIKGNITYTISEGTELCLTHISFFDSCFILTDKKITQNKIKITLREKIVITSEAIVTTKNKKNVVRSLQTGIFELKPENLNNLPNIGGEADPMKILQLSPGVSKTDINMGLNVRGGSTEQNLVIIDDAVIYNPSHLAGFLSIFNPLIIKKISMIKSGIPAYYGGRLSSVIEVETNKNIPEKFHLKSNIGLLLSDIAIESPIFGNKASLLVSARKSYLDEIVKPVSRLISQKSSFFNSSHYGFYDINANLMLHPSDNNRIYINSYFGNDDFSLDNSSFDLDNKIQWSNKAISTKWLHHFNRSYIMKNSAYYSANNLNVFMGQSDFYFNLNSKINDLSFCNEHTLFIGNQIFKAGIQLQRLSISPNQSEAQLSSFRADFGTPNEFNTYTISPYLHSELKISEKLAFTGGLRQNIYYHTGPFSIFSRGQNQEITDTLFYGKNKKVKGYHELEPRIGLRYLLDSMSSLKFSFTRNVQFLHQVNVTAVSFPTDFWMPASLNLRPQTGIQVSGGYYRNLKQKYEASAEIFYKTFENLTEFKGGLLSSTKKATMEENIITGKGQAYGIEFMIKKNSGKINGWISYTLSKSERKFSEINNGDFFPAKYDRTHDFSLLLQYKINSKWNAALVFIYASGSAFTTPNGRYMINGNIINQYANYNSFRMPDYHRMDLSCSYSLKKTLVSEQNLHISLYNVYSRKNPYYIYYKVTGDLEKYKLKISPELVSLFPFLPSISYEIRF